MSKIIDTAELISTSTKLISKEWNEILSKDYKVLKSGEEPCILDDLQMFAGELYRYITDYKKLAYKKAERKERNDYFNFK